MSHEQATLELEITDGFEEKPRDECGVYGVFAPGADVALDTFRGLQALQHRGQNGAGMALVIREGTGNRIQVLRGEGLVHEALWEAMPPTDGRQSLDAMVESPLAIGHTRYTTAGGPEAAQPFFGHETELVLAHNGHIEDMGFIAALYGVNTEAASDSALLTRTLDARSAYHGSLDAALDEVLPEIEGAYCLTMTDKDRLIAVRDPWGFHPLVLGRHRDGEGYVVASETAALRSGNATFIRDIEPGEIVTIDRGGVSSRRINRQEDTRECMYEYLYIGRPDSVINGSRVHTARKNMGKRLAEIAPVDADVVVGVPASGRAAAAGYALVSGIPQVEGIGKSEYVGRSFIMAGQERAQILRDKFQPIRDEIEGMRIVLVDDSIIKGNTMRGLIKMLKEEYGVVEVHLRLTAPRYKSRCLMGMDTGDEAELIARNMTDDEICAEIGADSIAFNTPEDIDWAVNEARSGGPAGRSAGKLCTACVTGEYPFSNTPTFQDPSRRRLVNLGMPALAMSRA